MKKTILFYTFFLLFNLISQAQPVHLEWLRAYGPSGASGNFINTDLAGNVYVVGFYTAMDSPWFTTMQKFTSLGSQLYSFTVDTPCKPINVFTDYNNNEYIAGYNPVGWGPARFCIMKFNSSGVKLWRNLDSITYGDVLLDMAGDNNGNSVILRNKNGINQIVKYNSDGIQQLLFNIIDTLSPIKISLDNQSNIIITGYYIINLSNYNIVTVKYLPSGIKLWKSIFTPTGNYISTANYKIKTGNQTGNIYIMTSCPVQTNDIDYTLLKYNSTGVQQWAANYNRSQSDAAYDMILDNNENIFVTGISGTVKFNSAGILQWTDTTSGMEAIFMDKHNNIYCTGTAAGTSPSQIKTIKIDDTGNLMWSINYSNGSPLLSDYPNAITVDTLNDIFITGITAYAPIPGYQGAATTIKYSQAPLDTISPKYFPLAVGNTWVYQGTAWGTLCSAILKRRVQVSSSININSHMYFLFRDATIISGGGNCPLWGSIPFDTLRIDSINNNIYKYSYTGCNYSLHEIMNDSLKAHLNDIVNENCSADTFYKCIDTTPNLLFGQLHQTKKFSNFFFEGGLTRSFAMGIGQNAYSYEATYGTFNASLVGCVIDGIVYGDTSFALYYTVSGTVYYQDNNQPVTNGYVKALALDKNNYQVITVDSTRIQSNGSYSLIHVHQDSIYIMAYADDEMHATFVPTYYDSTTHWQNAHVIYPTGNLPNIDIHVLRAFDSPGPRSISGGVFEIQSSLTAIKDAIVYAKLNGQYVRYDFSKTGGNYILDSLPQGTFELECDRIGYEKASKKEILNNDNLDTINFYLLKVMKVTRDFTPVPTSFNLYQNYPNPFNPVTTIKFDLPKTSAAQLIIYDLLGKEVIKLVDKKQAAGSYEVKWDGSNFASGVYFYKLEAGDFVQTKKLVLIK